MAFRDLYLMYLVILTPIIHSWSSSVMWDSPLYAVNTFLLTIAQLVEHETVHLRVMVSSPMMGTIMKLETVLLFSGHPDMNNHTETILITTLLG